MSPRSEGQATTESTGSNAITLFSTPKIAGNGPVIEFLLSYPMYNDVTTDWTPLEGCIGNYTVAIHPPISANKTYEPDGRLGSETLEAYCTLLRVSVTQQRNTYPKPADVWPLVESLLQWIRVKTRHFWLLHGSTGFSPQFKASVLVDGAAHSNHGTYRRRILLRPMTKELWAAAGAELLTGSFPPVSEALFCDALLSIAAREDRKATLELGVACEIEITALLEALARQSLQSPAKADYLRREMRGNWVSFADKLEKCTLSLGLPNPTQFIAGVPHNWVDTVKKLYRTRNAIAHGRELGAETIRVGNAVPAANALFKYTRAARHGAGLWTYALPSSTPFPEQLIGIME